MSRSRVLVPAVALVFCGSTTFVSSATQSSPSPAIIIQQGNSLVAVSFDGSRLEPFRALPAHASDPAVSPAGNKLAFAAVRGIWTAPADGRRPRLVVGDGSEPAWSPDAKSIFFVRSVNTGDGPCGSIFRIDTDGRNLRRITRATHFHDHRLPAVSPDGRAVAFSDWNGCAGGTSSPRVRVVDPSGLPTRDLIRLPRNGYYPDPEHGAPAWSPDGRELALVTRNRIATVNRDGSHLRLISPARLNVADSWTRPSWSPTGEWIAFVADARGTGLYVIHPDGTGLRRVGPAEWSAAPAWLPNGLP